MHGLRVIVVLLTSMALSEEILQAQKYFKEERLHLNTKLYNEFAPVIYQGDLVFVSNRKRNWLKTTTSLDNMPLTDLYRASLRRSGKFAAPHLFSHDLTTRFYEGPASFTADGNRIYFSRTIDVSKRFNSLGTDTAYGIFYADKINGRWANLSAFTYNHTDYNLGFPFVTPDGKQLYFSSQNPAGEGGFDIWVSDWTNSRWGTPRNLGKTINTTANEVFPFYHPSGRLYFSSRGHNSPGKLKLYYSDLIDGEWQEPVTLPPPFNSAGDDFGIFFNETLDTAYLASTRKGSMDIYMVYSTLPVFTGCGQQEENDYCFVFFDESAEDLDDKAFKYEWDLGDGTKIRAKEAEHCFASPGNYTISLNVIDALTDQVSYNEATFSFEVEQIQQPYISMPDTVYAGDVVNFDSQQTYLPGVEIKGYYWNFGDGNYSDKAIDTNVYQRPGIYRVQLGLTSPGKKERLPDEKHCVQRQIVVLRK